MCIHSTNICNLEDKWILGENNKLLFEYIYMDLSILIVTYNSADVIEQCIDSILSYESIQNIEIIIVDNHSKDHTLEILQKYRSHITLLLNSSNVGFSRAMNQGFKASTAPLVMTFNPDATLYPDTIQQVLDCFKKNPHAGLIAGVLSNVDQQQTLPHKTMRLFDESVTLQTASKYFSTPLLPIEKTPSAYKCQWVVGTCMTAKRDLLPNQQLYPENSFLFWEEYDLCQNIIQAKYDIIVCKAAKYEHKISTSFKYDPAKLSMAVKLSNAHAYRVKTERYGYLLAKASLLYSLLDKTAFYCILKIKNSLSKSRNIERERSLLESKVIIRLSFQLLMGGLSRVQKTDREASLFFNQ